jgi:hypothetical protein
MIPTHITVAILMVGVAVACLVWLQGSLSAASAKRLMGMMKRVGLDPGIATHDDPRIKATMKEMRQRCRRCPREGVCERWLAGKFKGGNAFCPNAYTFGTLSVTDGHTD